MNLTMGRGRCRCLAGCQPGRCPCPVPGPGGRAAVLPAAVITLLGAEVRVGEEGLGEERRRRMAGAWGPQGAVVQGEDAP